ncbi:SH3 domain-containing protein [Verrucomicrobiota bacterium]
MKRKHILLSVLLTVATSSLYAQTTQDVSAKIEIDRENIFVSEVCQMTLVIKSSKSLAGKMDLISMPNQDLKIIGKFEQLPVSRTRTHETHRFRFKARALHPGIIKIAPQLAVTVIYKEKRGFFWQQIHVPKKIQVQPITLSVSPVPENKQPNNFSGAVGQLSFDVKVNPTDVAAEDLITVTMRISGDGYIEKMLFPRISPGRNFKAYDPKLMPAGNENEKTFKQILIPQNTNAAEITAVSFTYFDPRACSYKTITKGPFPLTFHKPRVVSRDDNYQPTPSNIETPDRYHKKRKVPATGDAMLARDETARLAPSRSAFASFELTAGSVARVLENYEGWIKIQTENKRGWIPVSSLSD